MRETNQIWPGRLCGVGILPMTHGQDAHATGSGRWAIVQNEPNFRSVRGRGRLIVQNEANLPPYDREWTRVAHGWVAPQGSNYAKRTQFGRAWGRAPTYERCKTNPISGQSSSRDGPLVRNKANWARLGEPLAARVTTAAAAADNRAKQSQFRYWADATDLESAA